MNSNLGPLPQQGGINNGIYELWAQGRIAAVVNTGNLVRPLTKSQFLATPSLAPYQLFSHSDQIAQQQTSRSESPFPLGWGGRIADRRTADMNPNGLVPMITSMTGTLIFTLGQATTPLAIPDASIPLDQTLVLYGSGGTDPFSLARKNTVIDLRAIDLDSRLVAATSNIMNQAQSASNALTSYQEVTAAFPTTRIGNELKQVARVIKKRGDLSINRQIFFVTHFGFDTHQQQLNGPSSQTTLLAQLSQAMRAFYDEMGVQGLQDKVTQFTLSDFGRTMNPAGQGSGVGSDHAWGNHMLVLGGAVMGGNIYGSTRPDGSGNIYPNLTLGGPDDIDTGTNPRGRGCRPPV